MYAIVEVRFMTYMERIKSLREDHDLTQQAVAAFLEVGQKTYSHYELGKTRIPLESIVKLARMYDVSVDYICGVTDQRRQFPKR